MNPKHIIKPSICMQLITTPFYCDYYFYVFSLLNLSDFNFSSCWHNKEEIKTINYNETVKLNHVNGWQKKTHFFITNNSK